MWDRQTGMKASLFSQCSRLFASSCLVVLGLAACAKDNADVAATTVATADTTAVSTTAASTTDTAPDTAASAAGLDFPSGADEVVLRVESGIGGFRTFQSTFASVPSLLVTADGRVFTQGPTTEIFPGPMLPNIQVGLVDRVKLAEILADAEAAGLLGEIPDYTASQPGVTDVGSTVLTINAKGSKFVHEAYALGMEQGTPVDAKRASLKSFIDKAASNLVGTNPTELFTPPSFLVASQPAEVSTTDSSATDPQIRLVPWPAEIGVSLQDLRCAKVEAGKVLDLFSKADQLTRFFQDHGIYSLAVRPVLPGDPGCEAITG